jgi:hypothetical protein
MRALKRSVTMTPTPAAPEAPAAGAVTSTSVRALIDCRALRATAPQHLRQTARPDSNRGHLGASTRTTGFTVAFAIASAVLPLEAAILSAGG